MIMKELRKISGIAIILFLLSSGCLEKNESEEMICPSGQNICNGTCYDPKNDTCCNGILYPGAVVCCGDGICQNGYKCCNKTCYDPKEADCLYGRITVPSDLLPEDISNFRRIDNEMAKKIIAGREVQEASAAFVPISDEYNYVKVVLIRIVRYPYEGNISVSFNGTDTSAAQNALNNIEREMETEIKNEISAYYYDEDFSTSNLPSNIKSVIRDGRVNMFSATSWTPLSSRSSSYSTNYTEGIIDGYLSLNIYYSRISSFSHGSAEQIDEEVENVNMLFHEATMKKIDHQS